MIGELIAGRYRLVDRTAEGATGIVYRAVEEGGGAVAVKLLRPELAPSGRSDNQEAVEAFLQGRLDPAMVGKPPQPPGRLAEPDPNKATTVFHGAPPPSMAPPSVPPSSTSPPTMSPAPAAQPTWRGGRWKVIALAGGAATLLAFAFLVGRGGEPAQEKPEDPLADLIEAWRRAGLEPSPFAAVKHEVLADGDCRRGAVSGVDVIVCRFATAERAQAARKGSLRVTKGQGAASANVSGRRLLVAQSRQRRDPKRALSRLMRAFRDAGQKANKVDPQEVRTERSE
jgi:hypothetical protein